MANKVTLIGNLTKDPELKKLPSGSSIVSFTLGLNRKYTKENGEKVEESTFVDCTAFGKPAEIIAEYNRKGSKLYVEGRLKQDVWDDKATGQKRSKLAVIVDNFELLGVKGASSSDSPREEAPQRSSNSSSAASDNTPDDIPF